MKIGILTLPLHTNYGGILQAYALQKTLNNLGHEAIVLNKPILRYPTFLQKSVLYPKRFLEKNILKKNKDIFREKNSNKEFLIISQHTQPFIDKYISRRDILNLNQLKESEFDALVVGSDQIWRPKYYKRIKDAFFDFAKSWEKVKRIAYAPSFGTDNWEYSEENKNICKNLLSKFDYISIREETGIKLCKTYLGFDAKHVLDPTMLLNVEDYIDLFKSSNTPKSKGTLLNYVLDESVDKQNIINDIARIRQLIPFRVNSQVEDLESDIKNRIQPPVESWIRGFYDAEFIITDSFHACVFSILFKKPFIVIGNKERGLARFESLLKMFGLENRLVSNVNDLDVNSNELFSWSDIGEKINNHKEQSINYLKEALGDA